MWLLLKNVCGADKRPKELLLRHPNPHRNAANFAEKLSRVSVEDNIKPEPPNTLMLAFCETGIYGAPTSLNTNRTEATELTQVNATGVEVFSNQVCGVRVPAGARISSSCSKNLLPP